MSQKFSAQTTAEERLVFLSWKVNNLSNLHCGEACSITGPTFMMPTQPASKWETFIDFSFESGLQPVCKFRAQPLNVEFPTKFRMSYELSVSNEERSSSLLLSSLFINFGNSNKKIELWFAHQGYIYSSIYPYQKLPKLYKTLVFDCRFAVYSPPITFHDTTNEASVENDNCLSDSLKTLYLSEKFSDFTIVVEDQSFPVHKCILSTRSPVLAAMFESDTVETSSNKLVIKDFKIKIMKVFLLFIYTGQLSELSADEFCQLYAASDKYGLESLKKILAQKLINSMSVDNVCDMYTLGYYHNDAALKLAAKTFMKQNTSSVLISESWATLVLQKNQIAAEMIKEAGIQ